MLALKSITYWSRLIDYHGNNSAATNSKMLNKANCSTAGDTAVIKVTDLMIPQLLLD